MELAGGSPISKEVVASSPLAGLECRIGRASVVIPLDFVGQIVEYAVASPAPLTRDWISGLGVHAGRVFISVSLRPRPATDLPARRTTKAVVLDTATLHGIGWAVEVSSVQALVKVQTVTPSRPRPDITPPPWLQEALISDGRRIGWLDVAGLLREFEEHRA